MMNKDRMIELNENINKLAANEQFVEDLKKLKRILSLVANERDWRQLSQENTYSSSQKKAISKASKELYTLMDKQVG